MTKPTKILITEDEMIVALDLERRLRKLGYDCVRASSGEEAVATASSEKPDITLMDICLQGAMDGIAAAERIRLHNNIPIIYLTANSDEHTLQRAEITHPASYLLKPFKERELQICIEMALINHALQQELRVARVEMEKNVIVRTAELIRTNDALRKEIRVRQESEARIREQAALLDQSRDAIFVRTLGGEILYWNAGAERLYGHSKLDAAGKKVRDLIATNPELEVKALDLAVENGVWMGELTQQHRTGAERIVESRWTFMPDKSAVLVVETDIGERKKIEAQFLRAQRLESIGALASGIAHDLNNVFTPLIMTAQLMCEENEALDEKTRQLAGIIRTSANHGADMVKQILLFVRGSEGEHMPFRLEHLVKEVVGLLRETFPKNIRIRSSYATDLWSVIGDATRLHQVLMNLSLNARDAMPAGGELSLRLKNLKADESFARTHRDARPGDYICLEVADTGTGMTEAVMAKIFDPFFTTKPPGKGTGLGLATVQTIVQGHGGFLLVESKPGSGTRFRIHLPACNDTASKPAGPAVEPPHGRGELILVADDERAVREIVTSTLDACGYRTLGADDGISALALFAAHQKEIGGVMADLEMPNLGGFAFAQAVRKLDARVPVLLTSGANEGDVPLEQVRAVSASFLYKPFSKTDLLVALNRCLAPARKPVC